MREGDPIEGRRKAVEAHGATGNGGKNGDTEGWARKRGRNKKEREDRLGY